MQLVQLGRQLNKEAAEQEVHQTAEKDARQTAEAACKAALQQHEVVARSDLLSPCIDTCHPSIVKLACCTSPSSVYHTTLHSSMFACHPLHN